MKKGLMASSFEEFVKTSKMKLNYPEDKNVVVVLEEDGTEVDDDDYFQTLTPNTVLMLLYEGDLWSSLGDVTDHGDTRLESLVSRVMTDPGSIALMTEADLELISEIDTSRLSVNYPKYDAEFIIKMQEAAAKHLGEKSEIRDTLALLKLYHKSQTKSETKRHKSDSDTDRRSSTRKRQKPNEDTVDKK